MHPFDIVDKAVALAMVFYRWVPIPVIRYIPLLVVADIAGRWLKWRKRRSKRKTDLLR